MVARSFPLVCNIVCLPSWLNEAKNLTVCLQRITFEEYVVVRVDFQGLPAKVRLIVCLEKREEIAAKVELEPYAALTQVLGRPPDW